MEVEIVPEINCPGAPRGGHLILVRFKLSAGIFRRLRSHLEPSCGGLGASWEHIGSHLGNNSVILCHLGGHLGLIGAILERSWAVLDALTPRGPPGTDPREGGRGKGFQDFLQTDALDHLRPEGWWD